MYISALQKESVLLSKHGLSTELLLEMDSAAKFLPKTQFCQTFDQKVDGNNYHSQKKTVLLLSLQKNLAASRHYGKHINVAVASNTTGDRIRKIRN